MATFIVGYGTLLYRKSVGDTIGHSAEKKVYHPVIVKGFKRLFNLLPSHYEPSFRISDHAVERAAANIAASEDASFNGLAFEVEDQELAELDRREKHYDRLETVMYDFTSRKALGSGFVYSANSMRASLTDDANFLPDWIDISWARTGAYRIGHDFGVMYDQTTYLADGLTPVVERYAPYLDELIIKEA
ncbi:MAG: gamma-glutamylcyclotransferase family protein [Bacteroidales bacterium]|jgi:hypothetical protein|nr:gamma-glutamylcyclotransferase family protein [Bacteroidales bacterium]